MFEAINIQLGKENDCFSYLDDITIKYKNLYNVANYYIRQTMFYCSGKINNNSKEVYDIVCNNIKVLNKVKINTLNKKLTKINNDDTLTPEDKKELFQKAAVKALPIKKPSKDKWYLNYYVLEGILRHSENIDYKALPSHVAQQAIKDCCHDWEAYFDALKKYKEKPSNFLGKPKFPKYKKGDRTTATFTNSRTCIKNISNKFYLKLMGCDKLIRLGSNVSDKRLAEVKVIPFYNKYKIVLTFGEKAKKEDKDNTFVSKRIMGIDLGIVNFVSISNNVGLTPTIIKGNVLKAENQYFNKQKAYYVSILKEYRQTKRLSKLSINRNNRFRDYFYKVGHYIIKEAKTNNIDTIVVGKNDLWKNGSKLGTQNNQNFVSIPFNTFLIILENLCIKNNIHIVFKEESYTSKSSFLNFDNMVKGTKFSGYRQNRGLYKTKDGILINADINGASNIIRKQFPKAFDNMDLEYLYKTTKVVNYKDLK